MATGFLRGDGGARTYAAHVRRGFIRSILDNFGVRGIQFLSPPFDVVYKQFCKKLGMKPKKIDLRNGGRYACIGNPAPKKVVIYIHGGGCTIPISSMYFEFCNQILQSLPGIDDDVAVFMVQYSPAPEEVYPIQIKQYVTSVVHILKLTKADVFWQSITSSMPMVPRTSLLAATQLAETFP